MPCPQNSCLQSSPCHAGSIFFILISLVLAALSGITQPCPEEDRNRIKDKDQFDFIVIGSGIAGSLLVNQLTKINDWKVLLIVAGDDPSVIQNYTGKGLNSNEECIGGRCSPPQGKKQVGSRKALLYIKGSLVDYKPWYLNKGSGWDRCNINKYFKKIEKMIAPFVLNDLDLDKNHRSDGEYIVDQFNSSQRLIVDKLMSAYMEMGLKRIKDLNGYSQMNDGKIKGGIVKAKRVSTATPVLNVPRNRKNLYILKNAIVNNILFTASKVNGVNVTTVDGKSAIFYVLKEVIICAGAIYTPVLLMSSGIGPRNELEKLGIDVKADLPVGKNLQDQGRMPILVTLNTGAKDSNGTYWQEAATRHLTDEYGSYTTSFEQPNINAFISVSNNKNLPELQIDHFYFARNTSNIYLICHNVLFYNEDVCRQFEKINSKSEMIVFLISLCRPLSRGNIQLRSTNTNDYPKINPNYFSDVRDRNMLIQNLKRVLEIVDTDTFKKLGANLERINLKNCDNIEFATDMYWECIARTLTFPINQPVGSARMGIINDQTSVVDSKLNVISVVGLRVADPSILPMVVSFNVIDSVGMITERAADFIKRRYLD